MIGHYCFAQPSLTVLIDGEPNFDIEVMALAINGTTWTHDGERILSDEEWESVQDYYDRHK